jgi:glutamate/tyrosine decarboxylase-like PLP-dependent enzyme
VAKRSDTGELLAEAARRAADYLDGLENRSVAPLPGSVEALVRRLDGSFPENGVPPAEILDTLDAIGSPATVASAGGRYFGFVTGGALPAALAANYLAGAWDQNAFSWVSSPATAAIEETALRWIKEALGISPDAEGALVTGATMAHFTCLAAARNRVLASSGWDTDAEGLFGAPEITVMVGDEAHASLFKVLSMLGLGRNRVILLPTDDQGAVLGSGLPEISGPTIVCLQAGNVNSGAFDRAGPIISWAHDAGAWVHVDGAFGLWTLASEELSHLAKAFLDADSWAFDAHKWLNVPYDSGIALVADAQALREAMALTGAYLMPSGKRDPMSVTPDSSRRARGVEIWAALKSLGKSGLADLVHRNCGQARMLAEGLREMGADVLNDVVLNQVVVSFGNRERTEKVIEKVQNAGKCWCGGTVWRNRFAMRLSVSCWATTEADIAVAIEAIGTAYLET